MAVDGDALHAECPLVGHLEHLDRMAQNMSVRGEAAVLLYCATALLVERSIESQLGV